MQRRTRVFRVYVLIHEKAMDRTIHYRCPVYEKFSESIVIFDGEEEISRLSSFFHVRYCGLNFRTVLKVQEYGFLNLN